MAGQDSGALSPTRRHRIGPPKDFLPLSGPSDGGFSTRGQRLPGLISKAQSSTNLSILRSLSYLRPQRSQDEWGTRSNALDDEHDGTLERSPTSRRKTTSVWTGSAGEDYEDLRRMSIPAALVTPQMRSQRLIGNSNPRYQWGQYWKSDDELKKMSKPLRKYYERTNMLIQNYLYIDRLLDSSLPHNLLMEYEDAGKKHNIPPTISEESLTTFPSPNGNGKAPGTQDQNQSASTKLKRTPRELYRVHDESTNTSSENTPLLVRVNTRGDIEGQLFPPDMDDEGGDSQSSIVKLAIYVNLAANTVLLVLKVIVVALSSSVSVLASLIDAALDFLSTAIVWITTRLISQNDQYAYPIGRRRLEPVGILVFSVIMITSFVQVGIEGFTKLTGDDHTIVQLGVPAIAIMLATVLIKFACWLWCRLIKNSSVQALAQDAMTDVVFNIFSIIFPLVGYYARIWWLDPLGGILLSLWVIVNWAQTSSTHIRNLTGAAATADERNILLYLTMRFAKTIRKIQGLQAYHSGDKLNVEVDIVLDENTNLRDSHDVGESLQYVLESVPMVDRAFVHMDYADDNLPSHMQQDS